MMMMGIYLNNRYMYISLKKKNNRNCCADFRETYCSMDIDLHLCNKNHLNSS